MKKKYKLPTEMSRSVLRESPSRNFDTVQIDNSSYNHESSAENLLEITPSNARLGHKSALSQAKPLPFSKTSLVLDPIFVSAEVTNNSRLPLRLNDAKLLHVHEWKKEKELLIQ